MRARKTRVGLLLLIVSAPLLAQTSTSFKLTEHALDAGGHPEEGVVMTSGSFRVTLDAIGESVTGGGLGSASFSLDGGFSAAYPAPGEVSGLLFSDSQTLVWDPERSVGAYNLYRDTITALSGLGYGQCEQQDLEEATATDPDTTPAGDGYFYLVTAENRLAEEGTKGDDGDGSERANPSPCP